jgi:ABC-type enterobactin transport system permease subunit
MIISLEMASKVGLWMSRSANELRIEACERVLKVVILIIVHLISFSRQV